MNQLLFEELSVKTFVLQFYFWFSRGYFTELEKEEYYALEKKSISVLKEMKAGTNVEIDLINELFSRTEFYLERAKGFMTYKQIATDKAIAAYVAENPQLFQFGIELFSFRKLFDIGILFRNGYMLHDQHRGYPEKDLYQVGIDCIDYIYSAAFFYNEAYGYYQGKKDVFFYDQIPPEDIGKFEFTRIQPKEEIMFRSFRESFINIVLYIDSFINSVGYHAFLDGKGSNETDKLNLRGIQGKRKNGLFIYSNLVNKIENISRIIGGSAVDVTREPFASYLEQDIELRNCYIHSSPDKPKKHFSIDGWKTLCDEMIESKCQFILNSFWRACYPTMRFPGVIFNEFHGNAFKGIQHKLMALE